MQAAIFLQKPATVTVNTFYYPNWQAYVDEVPVLTDHDKEGRITVPIQSGSHVLRLIFTKNPLEVIADRISLLGVIFFVTVFVLIVKWKIARAYWTKFLLIF